MRMTCAECHIGRFHQTRATYLQLLPDYVLVFPHAPAMRCDVCARIEFDTLFTDMLEALIADHLNDDPPDLLLQSLVSVGKGSHRFKMM